jgi:hypothetical protein
MLNIHDRTAVTMNSNTVELTGDKYHKVVSKYTVVVPYNTMKLHDKISILN